MPKYAHGLGVPTLALLVWLLRRRDEQTPAADVRIEIPLSPRAPEVPEPALVTKPTLPPDDLRRVEGIGPKVASLLAEAGMTTFAALAAAEVGQLEAILEANKLQMMDPTSWPEQARLAAAGEWDALEALQDDLKGGRAGG